MAKLDRFPDLRRAWPSARSVLGLFAAMVVLGACLSLQFPARSPPFGFLLPSPDVIALLGLVTLFAWRGVRLPVWVPLGLGVLFVLVRLFRIADGVSRRELLIEFRLFRDLPLVPEFARLVYSSYGPLGFAAACLGLVACMGLIGWAVFWALRQAERSLATASGRYALAAVAVLFGLISPFVPGTGPRNYRIGAFAQPTAPRIYEELSTWAAVAADREAGRSAILRAQARLRARTFDLDRLDGADVQLLFVESYGHVLLTMPRMRKRMEPALRRFEAKAQAAGFSMVTGLFTSPIYGGKSWLGHATTLTGVRIADQMQYDVLLGSGALSLSRLFAQAGYTGVLVAPAFERAAPGYFTVYPFARTHLAFDFGYRGPKYAWSPMPDQYTLEVVGQRELLAPKGPLFLEAMLTSTHTPWTPQPRYVEDWSALGDGSLFHRQKPVDFGSDPSVEASRAAYVQSAEYDLEVLAGYLARHVRRRSLVILLGDHQPRADVTDADPSWNVLVHVLSQDPQLLVPFQRSLGFASGALPNETRREPMERFTPWLMEAYSTPPAQAALP